MNIDKIITYNYRQFGNECGDTLVDLKNENEKLHSIIKEAREKLNEEVPDEEVGNHLFYESKIYQALEILGSDKDD